MKKIILTLLLLTVLLCACGSNPKPTATPDISNPYEIPIEGLAEQVDWIEGGGSYEDEPAPEIDRMQPGAFDDILRSMGE